MTFLFNIFNIDFTILSFLPLFSIFYNSSNTFSQFHYLLIHKLTLIFQLLLLSYYNLSLQSIITIYQYNLSLQSIIIVVVKCECVIIFLVDYLLSMLHYLVINLLCSI